MYTVAVVRDFIARHYLIGGDWGPENQEHSHHYRVEVRLFGRELDEHGYLVDIVAIENSLDELVNRYRDAVLNDMPEFAGLNPSLEHFARILCQALARKLDAPNLERLAVRLWEHESAWAEYTVELRCAA
jgi:6-pyruvoyltetrahydropterin/6-carboxytetrahydropterin synthase